MTANGDGGKMSKGSRRVINISDSGNKIADISNSVRDFCLENPTVTGNVDKVIIAVGTNDIRFYNSFQYDLVKDFRGPLTRLILQTKLMFPNAQIMFKCVLPFRIIYKYNVKSVHGFNYLLLDLCTKHGCIFLDCFSQFLDDNSVDYNRNLYRDKLHLNNIGLSVLCRTLKFAIYNNIFNPYMRINNSDYYYTSRY